MTDETVVAQSTTESIAPPAETVAPESAERRQEVSRKFMDRALRSGRGSTTTPPSRPARTDPSEKPADGQTPSADDEPKTYTKAELEKIIQSETDRRENKRQREAQAAAKREEERRLHEYDPQAYADLKWQEDQEKEASQKTLQERIEQANDLVTSYDKAVLDPVFLELPEKEQQNILKAHANKTGMEQRLALMKDAMAALRKRYKAEGAKEAEAKVRQNPSLIKQALVDLRDESDEPVSVSAAATNGQTADMNVWMRAALGKRTR